MKATLVKKEEWSNKKLYAYNGWFILYNGSEDWQVYNEKMEYRAKGHNMANAKHLVDVRY